jgi:hypothetical protein
MIKYKFLFNFSVTRTGGGLKRLYEYTKWFHKRGGAWFVIHPNCEFLIEEFPNNEYFTVSQVRAQRVLKDCNYLPDIREKIGTPDLYYSYGIPIYYRFGRVNWVHISNILPFKSQGMGLSLFDKYIKYPILSRKMKGNYKNADIISAESCNSLNLIKDQDVDKLFLSVNGSNDELFFLRNKFEMVKSNIAVVVGTQKYKALLDSYHVFKALKKKNKFLKLLVIGGRESIPVELMSSKDVIAIGVLRQGDVIEYLKKAKYYISTTLVENSFNAASEGVIFADESYISDIPPHRELLENEPFEQVSISHVSNPVIRIKREGIVGVNLKLWDDIIFELIQKVNKIL